MTKSRRCLILRHVKLASQLKYKILVDETNCKGFFMKTWILITIALSFVSPAFAARKHPVVKNNVQQLKKEVTGRCFYLETVNKTNLGWLSQQDLAKMNSHQRKFIKVSKNMVDLRKVYVPKNWCTKRT